MAKSKINLIGSKNIFIKYIFKIIFFSVLSVIVFNSLFSIIMLKLDLNLDLSKYFSIFTVAFSAIIVSFFSSSTFTNNGAIIGIMSTLPLTIYSLVNTVVYENNWIIFIVKFILVLVLSSLFGYYSVKKRKKIRVK